MATQIMLRTLGDYGTWLVIDKQALEVLVAEGAETFNRLAEINPRALSVNFMPKEWPQVRSGDLTFVDCAAIGLPDDAYEIDGDFFDSLVDPTDYADEDADYECHAGSDGISFFLDNDNAGGGTWTMDCNAQGLRKIVQRSCQLEVDDESDDDGLADVIGVED